MLEIDTVSFESKAILVSQPRAVEIRYVVTASNINGNGPPIQAPRLVL